MFSLSYSTVFIIVMMYTNIKSCNCDILVYTQLTNTIIEEFPDAPSRFGGEIPVSGLRVLAVKGEPDNGCTTMKKPPNTTFGGHLRWCVVVARYNCSFEKKVRNAQEAGYDAVIVHNVGSNELEPMSANDDTDITIPSIFVGESTGKIINYNYQYHEGFALLINNESPFNINTHLLLPFTIVVAFCFITMIIFTIVRCCRERRRLMRYRLPKSVLKKIPTIKFVRGIHQYDCCAICLEDYVDGEKLRILPCTHAYHSACIDPWLTKNRRVCPMCKRKVFVRGEKRPPRRPSSDNSSSSDVDDSTPLLTANDSQNDHGTFMQGTAQPASANTTSNTPAVSDNSSEDDDLLDASTTAIRATGTHLTKWQKFKGLFQRTNNRNELSIAEEGAQRQPIHITPSINLATSSSNNILNANLSGSFQQNDENSDDENILVSTGQTRFTPNLASRDNSDQSRNSVPSSSTGRIGVAAIPNSNFNPKPPIRGRSDIIM